MAGYRVRRERLDDASLVVVRGGLFERERLRVSAVAAHGRFGEYGVSVLAAKDAGAIDDLARDRLARFEWLTITTVGDLRRAGWRSSRRSAGRTAPCCSRTSTPTSIGSSGATLS